MTLLKHSDDAKPDMDERRPAPLLSVSTILAQAGAYGLLWLDSDLEVTARYGALVSNIEIGAPVMTAIPALFGYEDDIRPLKGNPGKLFVLPAVSMPTRQIDRDQTDPPRLNITAFWSQADSQFILLVARASSASSADIEISQAMRKRLMAEEALAQKSKELEIANRDLEEYAEIISHDLSAPLRAIRYLTEDIESAIVTSNHAGAKKSLADLKAQSKRMSSMMMALLDYASLGRKTDILEAIDTNAMIEEIIRALPRPKQMTINTQGNWPAIETMRAPLDLVIRNLIDNAIKHHDKTSGTICVKADEQTDLTNFHFTITDDGPGIDPRHHAAIMLPFRTLKPDPTELSRGMGLALVKRTVEAIGGSLTLNSNPQQQRGTQFHVKWPVSPHAR